MTRLVLDASVAVKWVLPRRDEPLVDEAFQLLLRNADHELEFLAPESFWAEVGNVFWKAVQRRRWSSIAATEALASFSIRQIETVPLAGLLDQAMRIALVHQRSFYDSLYVALAVQKKVDLVTADERLVNALGSRFPVRWLGAFSIT